MEFWVLFFIGIILTFITMGIMDDIDVDDIYMTKFTLIVTHLLVILCIVLVGGIAVAKFLGIFYNFPIGSMFIIALIPSFLTYATGYFVLQLFKFKNKISQICFVITFIVFIIGWTIPICNYNRNIETVTETSVEKPQERQLLFFCNIPVQNISGHVSGSSVLGSGSISGSISTSDELSYWYANENGEGEYDTAIADNSKIVFIEDDTIPYVKIYSYYKCEITKNHNNGKEYIDSEQRWEEYIFYLPKEVMQYTMN